jgi:hypothetical protein
VKINSDGSTVAANGKVVMAVGPVDESRAHFPDVGERSRPGPEGISLPLETIERVVKNLPKEKRMQHAAITKSRDPRKFKLTTTDMVHEQSVEVLPKPERFPDWKGVFRKVRGAGSMRICLNRKVLIDLLKAMEEACPDSGGENHLYIEMNPDGVGLVLRSVNRDTGQRAIGGITAYKTGEHWLPKDAWEQIVFGTDVKTIKKAQV